MKKFLGYSSFIIMLLLILVMAGATFIEKQRGTEYVLANIYHSWWMNLLWAWLVLFGGYYILERKLIKNIPAFLLHLSFIIMLFGAAVSHFTSYTGKLNLREGETGNTFFSPELRRMVSLPFTITLHDFQIEYYPGTYNPSSYTSSVEVHDGNTNFTKDISMNNILKHKGYRFYQTSYDDDLKGTVLSIYYDPVGVACTYFGYILMFLSMIWILIKKRERAYLWIGIAWILALSGLFLKKMLETKQILPILNTPLLSIHVSFFIIAYSIGIILFLNSIITLSVIIFNGKNSSYVKKATRFSEKLIYPSTFGMAIGIFVGAVWANVSWGSYWGWDPKEVWALVTFMIMSLLLHKRTLKFVTNPIVHHLLIILIVASMIMTYFGVNHILGGIHSYGAN